MCERSAMAHQHRCAFVLTVILALLALTGPASAADGPCTEQQFMFVATAADPTPVVMGMMGSAPACATCFIGCATKTGAEKAACGMACSSAAVASTNDAAASPTSVPAEPAAEEAATTSATSVPAEPAAEEAATTSASECKDSPDEVVNVASGTRPSTFLIPVLDVPFRRRQVACSPTAQLARHCAARTPASHWAVLSRVEFASRRSAKIPRTRW